MHKRLLLISGQLIFAAVAATTAYAAPAAGQWGYPPYYGPYYRYAAPDSTVRLDMKPKEAEVFVDGYYAGVVDDFNGTFQRLRLPPGEHEIAVYMRGYHTYRQKVLLTPDNTLKIKRNLEKLEPGDQPEPRPEPTGPLPQAGSQGAGRPAYPPYPPSRGPGRRTPPPPTPPDTREPPAPGGSALGSLALHLQPPDADILVDGQPWRGPTGPSGQDRLTIELPEGRHTIEIRRSGYRSYLTDVDIKRGETLPLEVSLRQ